MLVPGELLRASMVTFVTSLGPPTKRDAALPDASFRRSMFAFLVFLKHYPVAQCSGLLITVISLLSFAVVVWSVIRNSIDLQIDWIPRSFNDHANAISRIIDFAIGACPLNFFNYIDHIWGPHTVDRFANFNGASLPGSIPVIGTRAQRVWMLFVMTGEGRIIPCPPGNKAICRVPT